jgi:hypothetical protein
MNALPASLGKRDVVTWIPVDILATILLDLALSNGELDEPNPSVYHLRNPREASWSDLLPVILKRLAANRHCDGLAVIPWEEWIAKLESAAKQGVGDGTVPGVKLLPFFQSMGRGGGGPKKSFATAKAQEKSAVLRELEPVGAAWMQTWMGQWGI